MAKRRDRAQRSLLIQHETEVPEAQKGDLRLKDHHRGAHSPLKTPHEAHKVDGQYSIKVAATRPLSVTLVVFAYLGTPKA